MEFDFGAYAAVHPYHRVHRPAVRAAEASAWFTDEIESSADSTDLKGWRERFHIPSDVHLFALAPNERADQPPEGLVAIDELTMEAGLRFPLHPAISRVLAA